MTPPLFLLDPLPDGDVAVLAGEEGRHAARVKRIGLGEVVWLGDGRGTVLDAQVSEVGVDRLVLQVTGRRLVPAPQPRLEVVQALPKGDRAELAVELMTELGVDDIVPWAAGRSIVQWRADKAARGSDRWQRTATEAAKQSRRAWVPNVTALHTTAELVGGLGRVARLLVLHEEASLPIANVDLPDRGDVVVVVGPEGGVTPEELSAFTGIGGIPVRLGSEVLRTSTAGAAAVAALSLRLGRWG